MVPHEQRTAAPPRFEWRAGVAALAALALVALAAACTDMGDSEGSAAGVLAARSGLECSELGRVADSGWSAAALDVPMRADAAADSLSGATQEQVVGTNTVVEGVDEGDVFVWDGSHLHVGYDGQITTVGGGGVTHRTPVEGVAGDVKLVADGDFLYVFGTTYDTTSSDGGDPGAGASRPAADIAMPMNGATYIGVYTTGEQPELIEEGIVGGDLADARVVNGELRVLTRSYRSEPLGSRGGEALVADVTVNGEARDIGSCEDVFVAVGVPYAAATTTHLVTTTGGLDNLEVQSIDGPSDTFVVTDDAVVVAASSHNGAPSTLVWWFDTSDQVELAAVGTLDGTLLNDYALTVRDGTLWAATTIERADDTPDLPEPGSVTGGDEPVVGPGWGTPNTEGVVWAAVPAGGGLDVVGSVDGLGVGERIHSVRFVHDRAYVVTFERVDPLYVIDLSNPRDPQMLGELKITGYSEYLHMVGDDKLIGVGVEADDNGTETAMKVSLFGVEGGTPVELDTITDDRYVSTVGWDRHSWLWDPERNTAVFSVIPSWWSPAPPVRDQPQPDSTNDSEPGEIIEPVEPGAQDSSNVGGADGAAAEPYEPPTPPSPAGAYIVNVDGDTLTFAGVLTHPGDPYMAVERTVVVGDTLWSLSRSGVGRSLAADPQQLTEWFPLS